MGVDSEHARQYLQKLEAGDFLVGIVGMGYVGLPLGLAFARQGIRVLGFDTDPVKCDALEAGTSYLGHLPSDRVKEARDRGCLAATPDMSRLSEPDAILICVPTPLGQFREPDLGYVVRSAEQIAKTLRPGQLIVLESTTYPGTTEEELLPILERTGLTCGQDFFLAYSPERENPGDVVHTTSAIPKVVGGVDADSTELAWQLYSRVVPEAIRVSSCRVAEASKITENLFRAVNIALVNELKTLFHAMDIDIREVLDAAESKPFGFMRFDPGPGWGGHCIPIDPFYLSWKARQFDQQARFVELAGAINTEMPKWVLARLQDELNEREKSLKGSRILLLGLAYKKNVSDARESPAFEILDLLLQRGARVSYHDPHVPQAPAMRSWPELPTLESQPLSVELLQEQDAVMVVTDHENVDYELVARHAPLIIDTRGVYPGGLDNVRKA